MVTGSDDATLKLWNVPGNKLVSTLKGHKGIGNSDSL